MGGLILIRLKCYVPPKPIAFQIVSYDLILNELRGDFSGKLKLIGWHYCHSLCSTESWLISLQKEKLELSLEKEVFASLFWALVAENPCRREECGRTFYCRHLCSSSSSFQGSSMIEEASMDIFNFRQEMVVLFFFFSFCAFILLVLLAKQCSHF